ncbi:unnamed protein product [Prorocentrum cordatum]|uniref:Uncharacterized protein n=1 Tax=Prorocentrum cordatum TaxID=2364126 RepID=A0ABN9XQX6_9DINO|nr:unnamed protein product [Polarella glacialis]
MCRRAIGFDARILPLRRSSDLPPAAHDRWKSSFIAYPFAVPLPAAPLDGFCSTALPPHPVPDRGTRTFFSAAVSDVGRGPAEFAFVQQQGARLCSLSELHGGQH